MKVISQYSASGEREEVPFLQCVCRGGVSQRGLGANMGG